MTAPSPQPSPPDHLRHLLKDAEAELHRRLREACEAEANGLSSSSASEIRRLEDSVFAAALAAQKTMKLRRQVERVDPRERAVPIRIADAPGFALGVQWHAEYDPERNPINRALFKAFGEALAARK